VEAGNEELKEKVIEKAIEIKLLDQKHMHSSIETLKENEGEQLQALNETFNNQCKLEEKAIGKLRVEEAKLDRVSLLLRKVGLKKRLFEGWAVWTRNKIQRRDVINLIFRPRSTAMYFI